MYKVLLDNTLMCDSRIEELALINPVVKLEENKAGSFSFKIPPAHPYYDSIQKRKTIVDVYLDDEKEPVFSGMCIEVSNDLYKQKEIYCEGDLAFLNDSIQRPKKYQGYTVRGLLEAYIANHNAQVEKSKQFEVGVVTVTDSNDYISCYTNMENTMKAIKEDLVDDLGGIIRIRHEGGVRYIDYLAESLNTNSQDIKLGKNLVDFKSNIDTTDIATAIIPLGAKLEESAVDGLETRLTIESVNDGFDYVRNADAVAAYGWIYKTVTYDNVTTPEALKRKGEQYLAETQFENVYIEAKVVDLHLADKSVERFKLSDNIRAYSAAHGMNKYFRLTKQTLNLNNPEKDKFTLGKNEKTTLSAKSNQVNEEVKKAVESIVPPNHILNQAVANATALITSAMGGFVVKTNNELLIMDTDDIETATKVWRWNINGLGYSSKGYKGPYALAMTMDGTINADFINGGTILGQTFKGGSIEIGDENSGYYAKIDESGKLTCKGANVYGHIYNISDDGAREAEVCDAMIGFKKKVEEEMIQSGMLGQFYGDICLLATKSLKLGIYRPELNNYTSYYTVDVSGEAEYRHTFVGKTNFDSELALNLGLKSYGSLKLTTHSRDEVGGRPGYIWFMEVNEDEAGIAVDYLKVYEDANVRGNLYTGSGTIAGSDRNIKNSIQPLDADASCDFVYALKPSKYKYNEGTSQRFHHGFIAQDVKEAMGDDDWGVYVDNQDKICGHKGIRYDELIADLVAVVQSQNERIKKLEEGSER